MQGFPVRVWVASAVLTVTLAGCAAMPAKVAKISCPDGGVRATAELLFGRVAEDGSGGVSEANFTQFLDGEVSPRFPEGLTVIDAGGRWTPPTGTTIREPAKLVMIVLPGGKDDHSKLEAVRMAYVKRFHQQSQLLMTHGDCVSF